MLLRLTLEEHTDVMDYKLSIGIKKAVKSFVYFGIPFLLSAYVQQMPDVANLTIGGLLVMLANYIKTKAPDSTLGKIV